MYKGGVRVFRRVYKPKEKKRKGKLSKRSFSLANSHSVNPKYQQSISFMNIYLLTLELSTLFNFL
jgi:hypothetical protein